MQPAANHIDDASHQREAMKSNEKIGSAYEKRYAFPVSPYQGSHGFGLHDNRICNRESGGADGHH